jgi:hypothetical protein
MPYDDEHANLGETLLKLLLRGRLVLGRAVELGQERLVFGVCNDINRTTPELVLEEIRTTVHQAGNMVVKIL